MGMTWEPVRSERPTVVSGCPQSTVGPIVQLTQIPNPREAKLSGTDPLPLRDLDELLDELDVLWHVLVDS